MHFDQFKASLAGAAPPAGVSLPLQALWWVAKGDWHKAHGCCQESHDELGAWVHAHLHRVEGDESNAGYWYRRAGKPHATVPLDDEWETIVRVLLGRR